MPLAPVRTPSRGATVMTTAPAVINVCFISSRAASSNPSATRNAILRVLIVSLGKLGLSIIRNAGDGSISIARFGWTFFGSTSPGTLMFIGFSSFAGTDAPSPAATLFASSLSTWANRNNMRSRIGTVSTLPNSKRKALIM